PVGRPSLLGESELLCRPLRPAESRRQGGDLQLEHERLGPLRSVRRGDTAPLTVFLPHYTGGSGRIRPSPDVFWGHRSDPTIHCKSVRSLTCRQAAPATRGGVRDAERRRKPEYG